MRNYVIINGVNSLTIQGLAIKTLPPITKPIQRTLREEIDGRDGDIVTTLGYGAYDKTIEIGLFGTFDIDEVIAYFNQKGTITFSNEADKVYYFEALDQVDYAELLKFRTANVVLHCQPFKYPLNETPLVEEYEYVEATGTNVTLDNTSEAIFNKIDLLGNTEQTQYTGKNLLNPSEITDTTINGVTFTIVKDSNGDLDYINVNGTASALVLYQVRNTITLSAGTYTWSGCPSGGSTTTFDMRLDGSGTVIDKGNGATFTITGDVTYQNTRIIVRSGYVANNLHFRPMLEKGSTKTTYEPYVGGIPSPNPNYPQDIHVVSGDNEISITGKNLYDNRFSDYTRPLDYLIHPTTLEQGQAYTLKATLTGTKISGIVVGIVPTGEKYADFSTRMYIAINSGGNTEARRTITIDETWTSPKLVVYCPPSTLQATFESIFENYEIQLEKGTTATTYEPYTGETYPLTLGNLEMASIPNTTYKDLFVKDGDTWYKRQAIGKYIFDSTWSYSQTNNTFQIPSAVVNTMVRPRYTTDLPMVYCNYLSPVTWATSWATLQSFIAVDTTQAQARVRMSLPNMSLQDFQTWLTTHEMYMLYQLISPIDIEITNETLIDQLEAIKNAISYKGQTNITQTNNDLPFILDLSALKENSDHLVIDNIGNIYSKPTLDLEGTGIVDIYLNDTQMFEVDLSEKNEIVIDTEKMEAYNPTDNTLANRQVTGDYSKFKLDSGENDLRFSGDLTKATITRYERWL